MSISLDQSPEHVARALRERGITLAWAARSSNGEVRVSHPELAALPAHFARTESGYAAHEAIFLRPHAQYDALLGAFVHETSRGQAAGGTRLWRYATLRDYLRDGLRLAQGMTRKNALAGLFWGGGKGVIGHAPELDVRDRAVRDGLFRAYGTFASDLNGCYVTAEDVGVYTRDMNEVFARTRYVTCIGPELGGSGDPSPHTARGVLCGIEAALAFLELGSLSGKTVAVQGVGNVGGPLVKLLLDRGARVVACDVSAELVERRRAEHAGAPLSARVCAPGDTSLFAEACDVFAPCALGAVLNPTTIPLLRARVVCGAANNQLDDAERDGQALRARGIAYVPDFLVNRMGIVNCANEQYGRVSPDPAMERHFSRDWPHSIYELTRVVMTRARTSGETEAQAAIRLADELAKVPHPIFPERSRQIIAALCS